MAGAREPEAVVGAAALAGGPAENTLTAPPAWRAVDFASDLHLSAAMPKTLEAFEHYLLGTPADAIFLLGDLFEVWVGDDSREQPFEARVVLLLRRAAAQRSLFFIAGNRDFLLGEAMCTDCGMTPLADPTCLLAFGRRTVLSHGDALCLADERYQAFRTMVRHPAWQADFLRRPLADRLAMAREMRRQSAERQAFDGNLDLDLDAEACISWVRDHEASAMLHGHTHRPATHDLGDGLVREVLSDWDLDDPARPRAQVLRLSAACVERLSVEQACGGA